MTTENVYDDEKFQDELRKFYGVDRVKNIGVTLGELSSTKVGQKIIEALRTAKADEFRTKRGERAMVITASDLERVQSRFGFKLVKTLDGMYQILPNNEAIEVAKEGLKKA